MSDLSLLAAALARVTAADQPNPNEPEVPVLAGLSNQTKHQAVQPIALQLHQASIETYQAEFSRAMSAGLADETPLASPIEVIKAPQSPSAEAGRQSQDPALSKGLKLVEAIPNILPEPVKLSLRPLLTGQGGGSISAVPPGIRSIALKMHQVSIETYATTLALAPQAGQAVIAQAAGDSEAEVVADDIATQLIHPAVTRQSIASQPVNRSAIASKPEVKPEVKPEDISLTATAKLSPAALTLGMAQAAGVAQGVTDALLAATSQETTISQTVSLLDSAPLKRESIAPEEPKKLSAAQAAIALDQKVRAELAEEGAMISQAQRNSAANSPLWVSSATDAASGNIIQLPPETVARSQAAPGMVAASPEPIVVIEPSAKQAIAVAPSARRAVTPPNLSPWQLPQPKAIIGPRSGPQLYQQRLAALKQGRLHSRLPMDSFKAIWQGVRHKPSYGQWKRLLAAEARSVGGGQGNNRLSIVLGDSLSLWLPMQQLPSSQLWLNQGISGDTTAGILKRLDPLKDTNPSNIYVMAGVNDLKNGATDEQVAQNLKQIMRRLRQHHPQAQIHVQSILPASIGLPPGRIRSLNERIARIAQMERVAFLDIYPQFAAPNGQMIAQLTTDGIHLSPQGYALWRSILHRMAEPWAFANRGWDLGRS